MKLPRLTGPSDRQMVLVFRDDRTIVEQSWPLERGYLVDDKAAEAVIMEPGWILPYQGNGRRKLGKVGVMRECDASLLDLRSPDLRGVKVTDETLKAIGIDAFSAAMMQISRKAKPNPLRLLMWTVLLFAISLVLLILLAIWQSGLISSTFGRLF